LNSQNAISYEFHPLQVGQRNYLSSVLATISGTIAPDLSAMIRVQYNDGLTPATHTFSFGAVSDSALLAPGAYLVFGNSSAFDGPHYLDNLRLSTVAVPEPSSLVSAALGLAALAGYATWRRIRTVA
jgi:MYXO-CTERM domain-containing protein